MEDLTENMEQLSLKPRLCDDMLREVFSNIDNKKISLVVQGFAEAGII